MTSELGTPTMASADSTYRILDVTRRVTRSDIAKGPAHIESIVQMMVQEIMNAASEQHLHLGGEPKSEVLVGVHAGAWSFPVYQVGDDPNQRVAFQWLVDRLNPMMPSIGHFRFAYNPDLSEEPHRV